MAQTASYHKALSCSICFDPLKHPVPCDHSFCIDCVHTHWGEVEQKLHSCPNCSSSLIPRSTPVNNFQVAASGEELQESGLTRRPAERTADDQTERPADDQTERPDDDQTERTADDQTERPDDDQTERSDDDQTERTADNQTERSDDDQTEHSDDDQTEHSDDDQAEHSDDDQIERAAERAAERPADDQTERPVRPRRLAELCAGPGDVPCDMCTEKKLKAVQTCLKCLVSYCETHLQPHLQVTPLRKHQLVDPSHNLQENVCFEHNEFKRMFCRSDQQLICYVCLVETHKGHDTVSAAAERDRRQTQLQAQKGPLLRMIKDEETDQEKLRQEAENICRSTEEAVRHNREGFSELIRVLKQKRSKIEQQILTQQQTQQFAVEGLQNRLHEDVSEMKRTVSELDALSATQDHNHFLRHSTALSNAMNRAPSPRVQGSGHLRYYDDTNAAVSAIMEKVRMALTEGMKNVAVSQVDVLLFPAEPTTREGFLKYACNITLFTNGGQNAVSLTEDNRRATLKGRQGYSENDRGCHALSREFLPDRCYWEVKCEGSGVRVVVGKHSGYNSFDGRFWALVRSAGYGYTFCSENRTVSLPGPVSDTVGVYLDRQRGILSFYRVAETMAPLHRVQTVFPESLQTGVSFLDSGSVYFPRLNR